MKIITKKIGMPAEVTEVKKLDLDLMQTLVGGLIQPVYCEDTIIWCNEEGKLLNLDVNIALNTSYMGDVIDTVHGDIFITNEEEGAEGLSPSQINSMLSRLNDGVFTLAVSDMHVVPILTV